VKIKLTKKNQDDPTTQILLSLPDESRTFPEPMGHRCSRCGCRPRLWKKVVSRKQTLYALHCACDIAAFYDLSPRLLLRSWNVQQTLARK
jgi:hypothetical protein